METAWIGDLFHVCKSSVSKLIVNFSLIFQYREMLKQTKGYNYAQMVSDKSFLALNPTDKSELLSFICNELLSNKAVVRQIDNNVEAIGKAKKEKWEAEAQIKRLKIIQVKKSRSQVNNSQNNSAIQGELIQSFSSGTSKNNVDQY